MNSVRIGLSAGPGGGAAAMVWPLPESIRFCSTSEVGRTRLQSFVFWKVRLPDISNDRRRLPDGGYYTRLFPVDFAVENGIVTRVAADRFLGGERRSAEELRSQREQTAADQRLADRQADDIQSFTKNIGGDLGEAAGNVAAGITNFAGSLFGEGMKQFLGSLTPWGVVALTAVVGYGAYKVLKVASPIAELAKGD